MSCMTLFAEPITMTTTQLVSAIHHEDASLWRGTEGGTQAFKHELGRGHRRKWQAATPYALGETGLLKAFGSTCNIPLTNPA